MPANENSLELFLDENLPKGLWKTLRAAGIDRETRPHAFTDDGTTVHLRPKFRGNSHASFGIDCVFVFAEKHCVPFALVYQHRELR
jgi:hypothetical protein